MDVKGFIHVLSLIGGFAALGGIKIMDLQGLITALLVIIDIGFIMLSLYMLQAEKRRKPGNTVTEICERPSHQ